MMRERGLSLLDKRVLVLGLGDTGVSVARWVEREGGKVRAADTRAAPPGKEKYRGELHTGPFTPKLLEGIDLVCVSPGLSLKEEVLRTA
ncbi:MAG: hypothetical protein ACREVB_01265, partial [Burkholderiales bacterium]